MCIYILNYFYISYDQVSIATKISQRHAEKLTLHKRQWYNIFLAVTVAKTALTLHVIAA